MKVYLPVGDEVVLDGVVGGGVGLGQLPCREPPGRDRDVPAVRWSVHRADRAKLPFSGCGELSSIASGLSVESSRFRNRSVLAAR